MGCSILYLMLIIKVLLVLLNQWLHTATPREVGCFVAGADRHGKTVPALEKEDYAWLAESDDDDDDDDDHDDHRSGVPVRDDLRSIGANDGVQIMNQQPPTPHQSTTRHS